MSFGCGHTQTKTSLIACKIIHILNLMLQSFWKEMDSGKGYEGTRGLWCLIDVLISDSFFNLRYSTLDHFRCLVFIMICSFKWVIITYRLTFVCWFISVSYNSVLCLVFSHVRFFVTPWTIACQAPLSMGSSQQQYWSGLPFPPPGDLPNPGIKPTSLILHFVSCIGRQLLNH